MSVPVVRVWLSHDGYRDPDDNLSMLVGAAYARSVAKSAGTVKIAGVVFGDTKDGGQYYMLHPDGTAPAAFGTNSRYGEVDGNRQAAGNYEFFKDYGLAALKNLGPNWHNYDLLATDQSGQRAWNFHATSKTQISAASAALAADIVDAIGQDNPDGTPGKLVIYSAGGGANAAAEAIGYLYNQGYSEADIVKHFAVVQHGNNWVTNYEAEARELTRDVTIAISNQNYDRYANGMAGPDLKHAIAAPGAVDGTKFGAAFAAALDVATGETGFQGLAAGATFRATLDASDAGSHAFAVDTARLLDAWNDRLDAGEMRLGDDWAYRIDEGSGDRLRVIYDSFDRAAIAQLFSGSGGAAPPSGGGSGGLVAARIASGADDHEVFGGNTSDDLGLGINGTANGLQSTPVGLRFDGLDLPPSGEIASAYFVFQADRASAGDGTLTIQVQDGGDPASFAGGETMEARPWSDESVAWEVGAWEKDGTYRSADVSALIEAAVKEGGDDALDALAFRISGTGSHSAYSYDSAGAAPELVITYDHIA